jgi:hypothetical protein
MPPCHGGGRGFESRPVRKKSLGASRGFVVLNHFMGQCKPGYRFLKILQPDKTKLGAR